MKQWIIIIIIISLLSGCLESLPIPSVQQAPTPQLPQRVQAPLPAPEATQQNITTTPTPDFYNLSITTIGYDLMPLNTTFMIEYPLNVMMLMKCNGTVFHPEVIPALANNPTVLYRFVVNCSPKTKGVLIIGGRNETIFIPRIDEMWHLKLPK